MQFVLLQTVLEIESTKFARLPTTWLFTSSSCSWKLEVIHPRRSKNGHLVRILVGVSQHHSLGKKISNVGRLKRDPKNRHQILGS